MNPLKHTRLSAVGDALRTSYWFVPTLMAVGAVALWIGVYFLETHLSESVINRLWWIYTGGPDGAREVLAATASSMITVAGVTFSITIVALTLASQQFGPFLIRNFMRDRGNQIVLGTFIATFLFCLLALRTVRGTDTSTFVPHLSVTVGVLLSMLSLGVLIYFIHHVSSFVQSSHIIAAVSRDMEKAIDQLFPEELGEGEAERARSEPARELLLRFDAESRPVPSRSSGYITAVDNEALLNAAQTDDLVIRLVKRPGDFVARDDIIALVWSGNAESERLIAVINNAFLINAQRTATQDIEFVFNQIVEAAARALSPGVNDPFTATVCIDYLGAGLRRIAERSIPSPSRYDGNGTLRIIAHPLTFPDLTAIAFDQIRYYGRADVVVTRRLLDTIAAVATYVRREEDRCALRRQADMIERGSRDGLADEEDRSAARKSYEEALRILGYGAPAAP